MSKKHVRMFAAMLVVMMFSLAFLAACRGETAPAATTPAPAVNTPAPEPGATTPPPVEVDDGPWLGFPISPEPITLTYFSIINAAMSATMPDYSYVGFFQELEEKTNIRIDWIHVPQANEPFNLMVASGDFPDLINWTFDSFTGGPTALIDGDVLIPWEPETVQRYMPNFWRIMQANPSVFRSIQLDDGTIFQVPNMNIDIDTDLQKSFRILGPYVRQDWLDIVDLPMPNTVTELEAMLFAFRDSDEINERWDIDTPWVVHRNLEGLRVMAGLFGTRFALGGAGNSFHTGPDGDVVFGPITENFRTFLEYMSRWYAEGLINPDFPVLDSIHPSMMNSRAGFAIGAMGGGLTATRQALYGHDPGYELVSMPVPSGPMGHRAFINDSGANPRATAISSTNNYVIESMRWLDYLWSPEGVINSTWGVEGVSFEFVDGVPQLTDYVWNNPHGWTREEAISRWGLGSINFPNARDFRYVQYLNIQEPWQVDIQTNWSMFDDDAITMPPISRTPDEARRFANIMADISTHVDEMVIRFIIGQEPLENFDNFVNQINRMGIAEAIEIQEAAVARFHAR